MAQSISQRLNAAGFSDAQVRELRALFEAVVTDVSAVSSSVVTMATKLDAESLSASDYEDDCTPATGNLTI